MERTMKDKKEFSKMMTSKLPTTMRTLYVDTDHLDEYCEKVNNSIANLATSETILQSRKFVWSFGENKFGELSHGVHGSAQANQPTPAVGLGKCIATQISSGDEHSAIVTTSGKLLVCGRNLSDKLGIKDN